MMIAKPARLGARTSLLCSVVLGLSERDERGLVMMMLLLKERVLIGGKNTLREGVNAEVFLGKDWTILRSFGGAEVGGRRKG